MLPQGTTWMTLEDIWLRDKPVPKDKPCRMAFVSGAHSGQDHGPWNVGAVGWGLGGKELLFGAFRASVLQGEKNYGGRRR